MSDQTLFEVFTENPASTLEDTDLFYLVRYPYATNDNYGIAWSTFSGILANIFLYINSSYSVAAGNNSPSVNNAHNAFAFGNAATVNNGADGSFSFGTNTIASDPFCFVFGNGSTTGSIANFSFGDVCHTGGAYAFAFGQESIANGNFSYSFGVNNISQNDYAFSLGQNCSSIAPSSITWGSDCNTNAPYSIAIGNNCTTGELANNTIALGYYAQPTHSGSFVWSDNSSTTPFSDFLDNQFAIRATNGYYLSGGQVITDSKLVIGNNITSISGEINLKVNNSSSDTIGRATLSSGSVTVNNILVDDSWEIFLTYKTISGTPGFLSLDVINNFSFTINSTSGTDNSDVSWFMVRKF